jgi:hypothetical protein
MSNDVPPQGVSTVKQPVIVCESVLIDGELTSDAEDEKHGLGDLRSRELSAEELHIGAQRVSAEKLFWDAQKKLRCDEKKNN